MRLGLLILLLLSLPALAHDSWLSRNALKNAAGEWCCGEGDCGVIDKGAAKITFGGYRVDGYMTIGEGPSAKRYPVHETIPFSETQPSPDGQFWRCRRPDGSRRCFFDPPPPAM